MTEPTARCSRRAALALGATGLGVVPAAAGAASTSSSGIRQSDRDLRTSGAQNESDDARRMETTVTVEVQAVHVPADAVDGELPGSESTAASAIAEHLAGLEPEAVRLRSDPDAIELLADVHPDVVATALADALDVDVAADDVHRTPTEATMEATQSAVRRRLERLGGPIDLDAATDDGSTQSGDDRPPSTDDGPVSTDDEAGSTEDEAGATDDPATSTEPGAGAARAMTVERSGDATLRATLPGEFDRDDLRTVFSVRRARVAAHYPAETDRGYEREPLLTAADVVELSERRTDQTGQWFLTVELESDASEQFADVLTRTGFATDGVEACGPQTDPGPDEYCVVTLADGAVVYSASLGPRLAESVRSGGFASDGIFRVTAGSPEELADVEYGLVAALPSPVEVRSVDASPVDASPAEDDAADPSPADELPGPGIGGALASLAVVAAVLARLGRRDGGAERDR